MALCFRYHERLFLGTKFQCQLPRYLSGWSRNNLAADLFRVGGGENFAIAIHKSVRLESMICLCLNIGLASADVTNLESCSNERIRTDY